MFKTKDVCIIDDDPICVFGLKKRLLEAEFFEEIITWSNGLEAINFFTKRVIEKKPLPTTVFLDLNMPLMDGWDFLEEFKKIDISFRKNVRIHILSSSVDAKDVLKAKTYVEVENYFTKPIKKEDIFKVISNNHF